jgi:hypothetical protein
MSGVPGGNRALHAGVAVVLAAVFALSFIGVDRWRVAGMPAVGGEGSTLCALRRTTGLPCLTCGMTRSFCALGRGDLREAFGYHPLGPIVYVLFAVVMVRSARIAVTGRMWLERTARVLVWSVPVLLAAAVAVWIVRLWLLVASGEAAELWDASPLGKIIT